jgi:hypothetical protein
MITIDHLWKEKVKARQKIPQRCVKIPKARSIVCHE